MHNLLKLHAARDQYIYRDRKTVERKSVSKTGK
jgi:hypothetical protein